MCLDVLRALAREGEAGRDLIEKLASTTAHLPGAPEATAFIMKTLSGRDAEAHARRAVERLALLAAAAALADSAPAVGEIFARLRLSEPRGAAYGTAALEATDVTMLLERALPA
jgi:putative acyl-CoA dehydrogenase